MLASTKSPTSLCAFLAQARKSIEESRQRKEQVTIVTGNQSADLDTLSSSILYAYLASIHPSQPNTKPTDYPVRRYHPLLPISRSDLSLRPEFSAVFRHARINPEDLLTIDDLALSSPPSTSAGLQLDPQQTSWILVDHNKLEGQLGAIYGEKVVGCIDHHEDEGAVPQQRPGGEPRIIEKAGSCTSLVVQYFLDRLHAGGDKIGTEVEARSVSERLEITSDVAKLALAAILIDTNDLQDEHKTRDVDVSAAELLVGVIEGAESKGGEEGLFNQTGLFEEISRAKRDIGSLPLRGILRKDYKEWSESGMKLGMSSVVKPLEFLARKCREERMDSEGRGTETETSAGDELWKAMSGQFMRELGLNVWVVMTAFNAADEEGGEFRRELVVQWVGEKAGMAVMAFVEENAGELGLEEVSMKGTRSAESDGEEQWERRVWKQGNVGASRKQVGPMIRRAMSSGNASRR